MMEEKYCSTCFKTGEELDEALQKALKCNDDAASAKDAADRAEAAAGRAETVLGGTNAETWTFELEDGTTVTKQVMVK